MRAIVEDKYGSAEGVDPRDVALPTIGDHDVLIRVRAAAVNPADWAIHGGLPSPHGRHPCTECGPRRTGFEERMLRVRWQPSDPR